MRIAYPLLTTGAVILGLAATARAGAMYTAYDFGDYRAYYLNDAGEILVQVPGYRGEAPWQYTPGYTAIAHGYGAKANTLTRVDDAYTYYPNPGPKFNTRGEVASDVAVIDKAYNPPIQNETTYFSHAGVARDGQRIDFGTLGGKNSSGEAINNAGQVVGWSETANGERHAVLVTDDKMVDLGTGNGKSSTAVAVNDRGTAVGHVSPETPTSTDLRGLQYTNYPDVLPTRAAVFEGGSVRDLGTLGGLASVATGINDAGQVVGQSQTADGSVHAFLAQGGSMLDLGTLGMANAAIMDSGDWSIATAINDSGDVVGQSNYLAFLYRDGKMMALQDLLPADSGIILRGIQGFNALGQIIATGGKGNGDGWYNTYLLTPTGIDQPVYAMPEPATWAFFSIVGAGLAARSRRRSRR